jgi:hypothetical protein
LAISVVAVSTAGGLGPSYYPLDTPSHMGQIRINIIVKTQSSTYSLTLKSFCSHHEFFFRKEIGLFIYVAFTYPISNVYISLHGLIPTYPVFRREVAPL